MISSPFTSFIHHFVAMLIGLVTPRLGASFLAWSSGQWAPRYFVNSLWPFEPLLFLIISDLKSTIFRHAITCSPIEVHRRFEGIHFLSFKKFYFDKINIFRQKILFKSSAIYNINEASVEWGIISLNMSAKVRNSTTKNVKHIPRFPHINFCLGTLKDFSAPLSAFKP